MTVYLKTDAPEAELWVGELEDTTGNAIHHSWQAHRELSDTIHKKLIWLLHEQGKAVEDITGLVFRTGPGSFTGLRIGASLVQALSWGLNVPMVGVAGDDWMEQGRQALLDGDGQSLLTLEYGSAAHTTTPKK